MLNDILTRMLQETTPAQDVLGRFPQVQRQRSFLFAGLLPFLLGYLRRSGGLSTLLRSALAPDSALAGDTTVVPLTAEPQPHPLESALVTSDTRPSTIADTLAPGSGGQAQFQPFGGRTQLPTSALLGSTAKPPSLPSTEVNPLLLAFTSRLRKR